MLIINQTMKLHVFGAICAFCVQMS